MTSAEARKIASRLTFDPDMVREIALMMMDAVTAEREECAKTAAGFGAVAQANGHAAEQAAATEIAAMIRARSET
jgi:hypothetical protein